MIRPQLTEDSELRTHSGISESPYRARDEICDVADDSVSREDAGMVTDPLPVISTQSRGVGESHIITKDANTSMTARLCDYSVAPTIDLDEKPIPMNTEDKLFQTPMPLFPKTSSVQSRASVQGRHSCAEDGYWELLMRSSEAARKTLRDRAVAANKGECSPLTRTGGSPQVRSLSGEFVSMVQKPLDVSNTGWSKETDRVGYPGRTRHTSLLMPMRTVTPSMRRSSDPYAYSEYKALVFNDAKEGKVDSLKEWLFG